MFYLKPGGAPQFIVNQLESQLLSFLSSHQLCCADNMDSKSSHVVHCGLLSCVLLMSPLAATVTYLLLLHLFCLKYEECLRLKQ